MISTFSAVRRPVLTREQEAELATRIEAGRAAQARVDAGHGTSADIEVAEAGRTARHEFIESNIGLVVQMARKTPIPPHVDLADVVQDGILGLERALEDFDHRRGWKFSTYASWWIRRSIQRGLEDTVASVRIPTHRTQELRQAKLAEERAAAAGAVGGSASLDNADETLGTSESLRHAQAMMHMASLDRPAHAELDQTVGDLVPTREIGPDGVVEAEVVRASVHRLLESLDPENADLIRLRYGLDGGEPRSLTDLAQDRGVTPEAIRRRIVRALNRMRPEAERLAGIAA